MDGNWNMIGHEWAVDGLRRALANGRAAHAYLISGPPNIGKAALALRLAQALNCLAEGEPPCGSCRACARTERGSHPDVRIGGLAAQAAAQKPGESVKSRLGIDAVREFQADIHLRPYEGRRRVLILHDAEALTEQAANALLKTLEEPPPFATLILVAHGAGDLLPTIVSRCHTIKLRPVPRPLVAAALTERWGIAPGDAEVVAAWSGGRIGWAVAVARSPETLQARAEQLDGLLELQQLSLPQRFKWAETISKSAKGGEENIFELLDLWQGWWRDVLLTAAGAADGLINVDRREDLQALARLPLPAIYATLRSIDLAATQIRENVSPQLALEQVLINLPG
ncbi:MAG TPA: DNA polymerase III subunit delta' [Herpetosiphonaceae bacterium]